MLNKALDESGTEGFRAKMIELLAKMEVRINARSDQANSVGNEDLKIADEAAIRNIDSIKPLFEQHEFWMT